MLKQKYWHLVLAALAAALCVQAASGEAGRQTAGVSTAAARVKHVFLIVLENKSFTDTFETSVQDPYLQKALVPQGALLRQYYGTGHVSLDNYISMISGQAPTRDTANDCLPGLTGLVGNYNDLEQLGTAANGQVVAGGGCIYPAAVKTLADQMTAAGLSWKAYMEDMGNDPARERSTCGHPEIGVGTDNTNTAEGPSAAVPTGDAYATRHNPFVYFHSIIDSPECSRRVVSLPQLKHDLAHKETTPSLVFITPNLCHDAHDGAGTGVPGTTCASGEPGGLTSADAFLKTWVPQILRSPAYREGGLLIITFDESDYTLKQTKDPNTGKITKESIFPGLTCCDEQPGPNLNGVRPGTISLVNTTTLAWSIVVNGYGGDRIGALLLSPLVKPGSSSEVPYNHNSLLRSLEDIFGLTEHLGYAADEPSAGYHLNSIGNDGSVWVK
jgi:hypothetical protein